MVDKKKMIEKRRRCVVVLSKELVIVVVVNGKGRCHEVCSVGRNCRRRSDLIRYSPLLDRMLKKGLIG